MRVRVRDESGANAVEFALVLPILLMIMFGIFYGGLAYDRQLTLTQAAREAARFGATLEGAPDAAFFDAVYDVAVGTAGRHIDPAVSTDWYVCVTFVNGTTQTESYGTVPAGGCTVQGTAPTDPHVQVIVSRPASLELVFFRAEPRLRGEGLARYEGTT